MSDRVNVCARHLAPIGVILFMISCSSADPQPAEKSAATAASTAAATRDACALITAEEAAKILGSEVTATPRSSSGERSTCDYVSKAFESFTLEAVWKGAEDEIKSARGAAKTATAAAGDAKDQVVDDVMGLYRVDDLGDEAYFSRRTMSYVRKGDVLLVFQNAGLNEPARAHWEALARAAIARL